MKNYIIFESIGEASKDILATAVVAALHRTYPEMPIVVTSLHPEIWLHNPDIYRVYRPDTAGYFYDDYIALGTAKIFRLDPYHTDAFLTKGAHILEAWCDLIGIPYKGEQPRLFLTAREQEVAQKMLAGDKPIFLIQIHGEGNDMPYPLPWSRNAEVAVADEVVAAMLKDGYRVLQIAPPGAPLLTGVTQLTLDNRLLIAALPYTTKRLFIDSFPQHAAAALNLPSVVLWNTLDETRHGHALHKNIRPKETPAAEAAQDIIEQARLTQMIPPHEPIATLTGRHDATTILKALKKI